MLRIVSNFYYLKALIFHGVFAATEHEPIINPNLQTIVDVGANRGQFSLVSRCIATKAVVYLFEPLKSPYSVAKKIFKNDASINAFNCAIGLIEGECDINVSLQDDSSSIRAFTDRQVEVFPGTNQTGIEKIQITTLYKALKSGELKQPALLKIDVQGYEFEVLKSGESFLSYFESIYCELSFVELYQNQTLAHHIIQWLYEHEFVLTGMYNPSYDEVGLLVQADFLFKNTNIKNWI